MLGCNRTLVDIKNNGMTPIKILSKVNTSVAVSVRERLQHSHDLGVGQSFHKHVM